MSGDWRTAPDALRGARGSAEAPDTDAEATAGPAPGKARLNAPMPDASNDETMTAPSPPPDDGSDLELIARWRSGDERAATALVERHADALARYARSLGAGEEIDELVQDTFVRAFGSLDAFRGDSSLRTWLFTIERRLLMDRRRAERRRGASVSLEGHELPTAYDALDALVADEAEGRLRDAVRTLSPLQREVFTLRVVEGMAYREIAEVAGTTEGAARVHYHNAMRAIKEKLDA